MTLRASSMDRFLVCPTSALELAHPYNPDSPDATLGTAKHAAIAAMLSGEDLSAEIAHDNSVDHDDVIMAVRSARRLVDEILGWVQGEAEQLIEQRLDGQIATGTPDLVIRSSSHLVVVDFKTGFSEDEHRCQLLTYAHSARERWGMPTCGYTTTVEGQLRHGERIVHNYSANDLDGFRAEVDEAQTEIGKRITPGKHCMFCPRQLACEERGQYLRAATGALIATDWAGEEIAIVQLGAIYDRYKDVMRAASRYQHLLDAALQAGPVPLPGGRRLEMHEVDRTVVDVTALAVFDEMGWTSEDLRQAVTISKSGIDRIVKSKSPPRGGARMWREVMGKIEDAKAMRTETRREKVIVEANAVSRPLTAENE